MFSHPDLQRWLPSERLVAGADSGGFVFDQRVVTKALRDIGPFSFLEHGEPFSGCLFHEMVIADGRKMSKHLGNVVDPDELVEQYGADTVRLAVLYAAGPAKTLNWNDGALRFAARFLRQRLGLLAGALRRPRGRARGRRGGGDTAFMRERLCKWCDNGLSRITADLEELQMHKAVRNVTRLFERIQDFEKRVIQRRGAALPRRRRGPGGGPEAAGADPGAVRPARGRGAAAGRRGRGRRGPPGRLAGAPRSRRGLERSRRRKLTFLDA